MPIFEYKCENCGRVVEVLTSSATDNTPPPVCSCGNGSRFVKLYSAFAAHAHSHSESQFAPCGAEGCCGGACGMQDDE